MKFPAKTELLLIFFIVIGALIRFWNIGFQVQNNDELFTHMMVDPTTNNAIYILIHSLTFDFTPPIYYLSVWLSESLFGISAAAIRYPSAVAGVLLIPVMYWLGKEYRDDLFGIMMAGLTTVFYNFIFYSEYGRSYSIALLFFTLVFIFFIKTIRNNIGRNELWFGVFALLSLWTHCYTAIPLGVMILYLLWRGRLKWGFWVLVVGCIPLLDYIPLNLFHRYIVDNTFAYHPAQLWYIIPVDIFAFSAFVVIPIIAWSLWVHRGDVILRLVAVMSVVTYAAMVLMDFYTPMVPHYAMFLVPMLFLPLLLPFWQAITEHRFHFTHALMVMVVLLLEAVQIVALNVYQRGVL